VPFMVPWFLHGEWWDDADHTLTQTHFLIAEVETRVSFSWTGNDGS
jgi:hypothetical protein